MRGQGRRSACWRRCCGRPAICWPARGSTGCGAAPIPSAAGCSSTTAAPANAAGARCRPAATAPRPGGIITRARTTAKRAYTARALAPPKALPPADVLRLAQNALQLHRDAHVAFDLELAGHERGHAVELAVDHVVEVAERHLERAVGRLVVVADGRRIGVAVDVDHTLIGAELHRVAEGRLLAGAFLHFRGDFLQGHWRVPLVAFGPAGLLDL